MNKQTYLVKNGKSEFFISTYDKSELKHKLIEVCNHSEKILIKRIDSFVRCYDNGGKSLDRITVVFLKEKRKANLYDNRYLYVGISACLTGISFYQHTDCNLGRHLGKKVEFCDLSKELKERLIN